MEIVENVFGQEQIDELRRYETAKEFMSVIMGRANFDPINAPIMCCSCSGEKINPYSYIATISVQAADALLEALKGKGETDEVREPVWRYYMHQIDPKSYQSMFSLREQVPEHLVFRNRDDVFDFCMKLTEGI